MLKDKVTCLIFSCDKFSDLWDGNVKLFNQHWPDRDFDTYIVTDKPTDKTISGITIVAAGADSEWSERLAWALRLVKTEYVFLTLDDYFLIKPVDNDKMEGYVELMKKKKYDYLRFYPRPKRATREEIDEIRGIYDIDTNIDYSVNLYSCIWNKDFLAYTAKEKLNAWEFEVTLHKRAMEYGARCIVSYNKDYEILDVVRKGKILHKANRFFQKHPGIYYGNREVQSRRYETKLWIKTMTSRHTPLLFKNILKQMYVACGGKAFSNINH